MSTTSHQLARENVKPSGLGVQMMQLGIALHATAVLEQARIVRRNALQERFHGPLDLGVADGRVAEEDTVVHKGGDHVEDQPDVYIATEIPSRLSPFERLSHGRARRIEQHGHERVAQLVIPRAISKQWTDHPGRQAPESCHEDLQRLIEIAQRAACVRRPRLPKPLRERREHQPLTSRPATVDRGLRRSCAPCHLFERQTSITELVKHRERRLEHRHINLPIARATRPRRGIRSYAHEPSLAKPLWSGSE